MEGGHTLGGSRRGGMCGAETAGPDAGPHAPEDVVELDPGGALVPSAAASAWTVASFVQRHALALGAGLKAQPERARPIRQGRRRDLPGRWAARLALGVGPGHQRDLGGTGCGGRLRLDRAARLIGEQLDERRCVAGPLRSPPSSGGGLGLRCMASVESFEQSVSIEAQSWPSSFARQPDDTELRLVGVDEVAIDSEQPSDLGHGEELAGRSL